MISFNLDTFLSGHVFAYLMVFARVGTMMMLFPGIGETYVSPRIRMMFALSFTLLLTGPLLSRIPMPPSSISSLIGLIGYEIMIGIFFGTLLRILMSALETVGAIVSLQVGLSNATILNPILAIQSSLISAFMSIVGVTLIFASGLDHFLLRTIVSTYDLFPPGGEISPGDMSQSIIQTVDSSFTIGVELAMPFLVIGILMFTALGIMQKLMPQVQLFLVSLPLQIWGGIGLLGLTFAGIMTIWLEYVDTNVAALFTR
jgi:flagellar biosynthetic protein FliR